MLHALGLRAGVIVTGLRSAPVGAKPTSTGRRAPFQQVDRTPDTKTGTQCHDESLQYTDCAVEKCHMKACIFNVNVITVIGNAVYDRFSLCVFSTECLIPPLFEDLRAEDGR